MSATRPYVNAFANAMEAKLEANRHKGDREGWAKDDPRALLRRLKEEVQELAAALPPKCKCEECVATRTPERVLSECADIANFAMMIADVAGGMEPEERTP